MPHLSRLTFNAAAAVVLLCAAGAAWAQTSATSTSGGAGGQSSPRAPDDAPSPYHIKRLVDANRRDDAPPMSMTHVWRRLGLDAGEGFDSCERDCAAAVFTHELDGEPAPEVVLKLSKSEAFCRYLVFTRAGPGRRAWRLLGHVDHNFNRYEMTRHRVLPTRGRNWLVVFGQEGSGSGFSLYAETWYEVSRAGLRPVLHYPVEGRVAPWPAGLSRQFHARVVAPRRANEGVSLSYSVSYEWSGPAEDETKWLFNNRRRLRYVWDDRLRAFAPDAARSNISEEEVRAVADLQTEPGDGGQQVGGTVFFKDGQGWKRGGYEVFLKHNLPRLLRVARARDGRRKGWLVYFLKDCADTPEKKILERALRKRG